MELKLYLGGQEIAFSAEQEGENLKIKVDRHNHGYQITQLGEGEFLLRSNHKIHRVTAVKAKNKIYVMTDNESYTFDVPTRKDGDTYQGDQGEAGGKSKIVAPMPGKVVKILVSAGDVVEPRQKLVIVEAMKMENPLVAPFKSEIKSVNCSEAELVDSEKVLIELAKID